MADQPGDQKPESSSTGKRVYQIDFSAVGEMATQLFELKRLLNWANIPKGTKLTMYTKGIASLLEIVRVTNEVRAFMNECGDPVIEHYDVDWLLPSLKPLQIRADLIYLSRKDVDGNPIKKRLLLPIPIGFKL